MEHPIVQQPPGALAEVQPDERLWGMLAHLSFFIFGIIGPIIILYAHKSIINRESSFVAHHAKQALWWQVAGLCIGMVTCGLGSLVMMIWAVLAGLEANKGALYTYPLMDKVTA